MGCSWSPQPLEPGGEQAGAVGVLVQGHVLLAEDPEQGIVKPADGAWGVPVVHPCGNRRLVSRAPYDTQLGE